MAILFHVFQESTDPRESSEGMSSRMHQYQQQWLVQATATTMSQATAMHRKGSVSQEIITTTVQVITINV